MNRYLIALFVAVVVALTLLAMPMSAGEGETCFKTGERKSGSNKICYYDCLSGEAAITIKSHQLCPLSIRR